jgi:hypothetical protein
MQVQEPGRRYCREVKHAGGRLGIISEVIILIGEVVVGINVEAIELKVKRWHGKESLLIGKWGWG